jgi:hypothetical protein
MLAMGGYLGGLHLLVLVALWRRSAGGVAPGLVLLSVIPFVLALRHLLSRLARRLGPLDLWVLLYALWCVGSGVLYFQAGHPSQATAYAYGLYNFVLPMTCYFAARRLDRSQITALISVMVVLNAFAIGYGIYMHFVRPAYYADFVTRTFSALGATEDWQFYARLQSYFGSTSVGYLAACGIVLATISRPSVKRLVPMLALLFTAGALLSLQRASMLGLVVALGYLLFVSRGSLGLRFFTVIAFAAALVYGTTRLGAAGDPLRERVTDRATEELVEGLSNFLDDRGYKPGLMYLKDFPLGVGLGGTSSAADNAGLLSRPEVADANFMRIAADTGLIGLMLFLVVIAVAARSAMRSEQRTAWIAFLLIHCGIMLSTNILDSYYISHSFWLLLALLAADADGANANPAAQFTVRGRTILPILTSYTRVKP